MRKGYNELQLHLDRYATIYECSPAEASTEPSRGARVPQRDEDKLKNYRALSCCHAFPGHKQGIRYLNLTQELDTPHWEWAVAVGNRLTIGEASL